MSSKSSKSKSQWKRTIRKWLTEEQLFQKEVTDPTATFHFIATYPKQPIRLLEIAQPNDLKDSIVIAARAGILPEHQQKLARLKPKEREEMLFNLKLQWTQQLSSFKATADKQTGIWTHVAFTYRMFFSELTKPKFMRGLQDNLRSFLLLVWTLNHHLGSPKEEKPTYIG